MSWSFDVSAASVVLLLLGCLVTRPVVASEPSLSETDAGVHQPQPSAERARAFFDAGAQAYVKGEYRSAIEAFSWAYRMSQRPGLLFSLGQANYRAYLVDNDPVHLRGAIDSYRAYLRAQPSGARRQEAEQALERLVPLTEEARASSAPRESATWLMVSSNTPNTQLTIDDHASAGMPFIERVEPGPHALTLQAEGFETETRRVVVPEGAALAVAFELREQAALLDVAATNGAEVFVDGQRAGEAPVRRMPLKAGEHQIEVRLRGRQVALRRVALTPGRLHHERFKLDTTVPRYLAQGLLVLGGAAALATTALASYAFVEQSRAHELLANRTQSELTPAERDAYTHAVARRDKFRTGAVVSGIGAVALGSAALSLWLFEPLPPVQGFEPTTIPREHVPDLTASLFFGGQVWAASIQAGF